MAYPPLFIVGRLRLVQGMRDEEALNSGVFPIRGPFRRQATGAFLVFVDLLDQTPNDDWLVQELVDVAWQTYARTPGSITRRLRQAIVVMNQQMRDWNRSRSQGRQAAGVTLATLVGDELFMAQAGPALAFIVQPGLVDRLPEDSPWLSETPLQHMPNGIWAPLGLRDEVYVSFHYAEVGPGYTLFVASPHLLQFLSEEDIAFLVDQSPEDMLRDLTVMIPNQNISALVVNLVEPEPERKGPLAASGRRSREGGMGRKLAMASRRATIAMGSAAAAILGSIARILEQMLPEREEPVEAEASTRHHMWMWLAILFPLVLALVTATMYLNLGQGLTSLSGGLGAGKPGAAEPLPTPTGVVQLPEVLTVTPLPGTGEDRRRLIVRGTSAYLLNYREQVVRRVGLGDKRIIEVLKAGVDQNGVVVGRLVDMAWVPAGGIRDQGAILILDAQGTAWQIDAVDQVTPYRVAAASEWRDPRLIGGFDGNLYVLDAGLSQILKYAPTVNGYETPPIDWLAPEVEGSLQDVIDMAIDGAIYLLRTDGRVDKLVAGRPSPFELPGDILLNPAVACFAAPPATSVFLADVTRILQVDPTGQFQRWLVPPEGTWTRLRALWVDEASSRLYTVDDGRLLMAPLP